MITWPHAQSDWRHQLALMDRFYTEWVEIICAFQHAIVLCHDSSHEAHVRRCLTGLQNFETRIMVSDDTWIRDYGPLWLRSPDHWTLLDFRFNAWGGKFPFQQDNAVNAQLHQSGVFAPHEYQALDWVLEGGSIEYDGNGSLMTTSRCLLNENRNGLDKAALENRLKTDLGVEQILWLDHGLIPGDDTDGHIDTLARFCDSGSLCYVQCRDRHHAQYAEWREMETQLRAFENIHGQSYELVPLPLPDFTADPPQAATYANFMFVNGAVIFPTYQVATDREAEQQLSHAFPERQIIGLDCRGLISQGGALHCASMHIPADLRPPS